MGNFTKEAFEKSMIEYKNGRELLGIVSRPKGDKEDYQKMYKWVKFGIKPF